MKTFDCPSDGRPLCTLDAQCTANFPIVRGIATSRLLKLKKYWMKDDSYSKFTMNFENVVFSFQMNTYISQFNLYKSVD